MIFCGVVVQHVVNHEIDRLSHVNNIYIYIYTITQSIDNYCDSNESMSKVFFLRGYNIELFSCLCLTVILEEFYCSKFLIISFVNINLSILI